MTGSASGIGSAVPHLLDWAGWRVIGVNLREAEVLADLSNSDSRVKMADAVRAISGGRLNAVVCCAGISNQTPRTLAVNYFGAVGTMTGLQPLLAWAALPRAVAIGSLAATFVVDLALVKTCLAASEGTALTFAEAVSQI